MISIQQWHDYFNQDINKNIDINLSKALPLFLDISRPNILIQESKRLGGLTNLYLALIDRGLINVNNYFNFDIEFINE